MNTEPRPDCVIEEHLQYLDNLRESGITNMFGARSYLAKEFDLDEKTSKATLLYWMLTFSQRHPKP